MSYYSGWVDKQLLSGKTKKVRQTFNEFVHTYFTLTCRKCGSTNVAINYEEEGGYSEYTQWGSSVSIGCNDCGENDISS